jgi:hypothetical protein
MNKHSRIFTFIGMYSFLQNNVVKSLISPRELSSSVLASLRSPSSNQPSSLNLENDLYDENSGLLSTSLLASLRSPSSNHPSSLNLETDFYDASTGLHSEGVWHNCLAGIASLQLDQIEQAKSIATSLFQYSWDGTSFRRRAWSGSWNHENLEDSSESSKAPHQANYYKESGEHRCVQHGIALTFWSMLARRTDDPTHRQQHKTIAKAFTEEFWDKERWTTVSQSQGGGTIQRPSASAAKPTVGASGEAPYYRAVDQAIAVLACLEHIKTLDKFHDESDDTTIKLDAERIHYEMLATSTCQFLLDTNGFGYGNFLAATTYIGLERNRNFWHDGWVLLALISAQKYLAPIASNGVELQLQTMPIWKGLIQKYGHGSSSGAGDSSFDGTVWHWDPRLKDDASNVLYCGDNTLAYAIQRKLVSQPMDDDGFSKLLDQLLDENRGLSSVADAYPQVRLHPNTELAALLVWP